MRMTHAQIQIFVQAIAISEIGGTCVDEVDWTRDTC